MMHDVLTNDFIQSLTVCRDMDEFIKICNDYRINCIKQGIDPNKSIWVSEELANRIRYTLYSKRKVTKDFHKWYAQVFRNNSSVNNFYKCAWIIQAADTVYKHFAFGLLWSCNFILKLLCFMCDPFILIFVIPAILVVCGVFRS